MKITSKNQISTFFRLRRACLELENNYILCDILSYLINSNSVLPCFRFESEFLGGLGRALDPDIPKTRTVMPFANGTSREVVRTYMYVFCGEKQVNTSASPAGHGAPKATERSGGPGIPWGRPWIRSASSPAHCPIHSH